MVVKIVIQDKNVEIVICVFKAYCSKHSAQKDGSSNPVTSENGEFPDESKMTEEERTELRSHRSV